MTWITNLSLRRVQSRIVRFLRKILAPVCFIKRRTHSRDGPSFTYHVWPCPHIQRLFFVTTFPLHIHSFLSSPDPKVNEETEPSGQPPAISTAHNDCALTPLENRWPSYRYIPCLPTLWRKLMVKLPAREAKEITPSAFCRSCLLFLYSVSHSMLDTACFTSYSIYLALFVFRYMKDMFLL